MRKVSFGLAILLVIGLLFGATATPGRAAGAYIVQPGDTLFSLAVRFNVSISDLATINHVYDVNAIYVGEYLALPAPLPYGYYNTNPVYVPPANPGYTPPNPYQSYQTYVVRPGDYLNAIAVRFGITPQALLAANAVSLTDPSLLYVGQTLLIPVAAPPAYQPPPPTYYPTYHGNFYIVQPGDNLFGIAARFGQDVYNIARVNGILNLNAIYAGTALLIP